MLLGDSKRDLEKIISSGDKNKLISLLDLKNDHEAHLNALMLLSQLNKESAIDAFIAALKDKQLNVREYAAKRLNEIGDVRAIDSLLIALKDPEPTIRYLASDALGKIGDKRAMTALTAVALEEQSKPNTSVTDCT